MIIKQLRYFEYLENYGYTAHSDKHKHLHFSKFKTSLLKWNQHDIKLHLLLNSKVILSYRQHKHKTKTTETHSYRASCADALKCFLLMIISSDIKDIRSCTFH
jgi:hypothetical protein